MRAEVQQLLRQLLECWSGWETSSYYVKELAPQIASEKPVRLNEKERPIVEALQGLLTQAERTALPSLLQETITEILDERRRREEAVQASVVAELEREAREKAELEAQESRRRHLEGELSKCLVDNFLSVEALHLNHRDGDLLTRDEVFAMKVSFVQKWAMDWHKTTLDQEQAAAVGTLGTDVLVTARAGSGKTRTLVMRAIFLMEHCGVSPDEILLLAFNKQAVHEMRQRIDEATDGKVPHVKTFHGLAYALTQLSENLLYDDVSADSLVRSKVVQEVIDEHINDEVFGPAIRSVMLEHFRTDWETIAAGGYELGMDAFLSRRRSVTRETLLGESVKSFGEKLIANTLFENSVDYRYESNYRWSGRNYRPDFMIRSSEAGGVVIEYFGLQGNPDYDKQSAEKREFWSTQPGWTLVEFSPRDVAIDSSDFAALLVARLAELGVNTRQRSEEEIWGEIKSRAVDSFSGTMATFVGRCRKLGLTSDALSNIVTLHVSLQPNEEKFLQIGVSVHDRYLSKLEDTASDDFDGLMWRAVAAIRDGKTTFEANRNDRLGDLKRIRYVLVDEFQDFSQMFLEVINGIRRASSGAQFFCVGDDWQAINGFAGSDLRYFREFSSYFRESRSVTISHNYRSPRHIVEAGNAVMKGLGPPARAQRIDSGKVLVCDLERFEPSAIEMKRHEGDTFTPALLRIIRRCLEQGNDVVLLARRNGVPWFVNLQTARGPGRPRLEALLDHLRRYLATEDRKRLSISTAHKYKGLEKDAVIILDAVDRSYPLIHPRWVFMRVFGDSVDQIVDEERRLFYVAVTRAKQVLFLMTENARSSPFLADVLDSQVLDTLNLLDYPPPASHDSANFEVRVHGAYEVKDVLKREGYHFNGAGKTWSKVFAVDTDIRSLVTEARWFYAVEKVEVVRETDEVLDLYRP